MSFFSRLFRRRAPGGKREPERKAPADRAAPSDTQARLTELRHQARTGDPTIKTHRSGSF